MLTIWKVRSPTKLPRLSPEVLRPWGSQQAGVTVPRLALLSHGNMTHFDPVLPATVSRSSPDLCSLPEADSHFSIVLNQLRSASAIWRARRASIQSKRPTRFRMDFSPKNDKSDSAISLNSGTMHKHAKSGPDLSVWFTTCMSNPRIRHVTDRFFECYGAVVFLKPDQLEGTIFAEPGTTAHSSSGP